jgi:hypothetical protein
MPCYTGEGGSVPPKTPRRMRKFFLCRACKLLTRDQLHAIRWYDESDYNNTSAINDYLFPDKAPKEMTLLEWYRKHCDVEYNKSELERLDGKPEPVVYPY